MFINQKNYDELINENNELKRKHEKERIRLVETIEGLQNKLSGYEDLKHKYNSVCNELCQYKQENDNLRGLKKCLNNRITELENEINKLQKGDK